MIGMIVRHGIISFVDEAAVQFPRGKAASARRFPNEFGVLGRPLLFSVRAPASETRAMEKRSPAFHREVLSPES
jgi:hypothetical protein